MAIREKTPLYLDRPYSAQQGLTQIHNHLVANTSGGRVTLSRRTRCLVAGFMDDHYGRFTHGEHSDKLNVAKSTYLSWRKVAVLYREEHPGVSLDRPAKKPEKSEEPPREPLGVLVMHLPCGSRISGLSVAAAANLSALLRKG